MKRTVILLMAVLLAGCGSGSTEHKVAPRRAYMSGVAIYPGQAASFSAQFSGRHRGRLALVPLPGYRLPRLVGRVTITDHATWTGVSYQLAADGLGAYATAGVRLDSIFVPEAAFLWYFPRHLSPSANAADGRQYQASFNKAANIQSAFRADR